MPTVVEIEIKGPPASGKTLLLNSIRAALARKYIFCQSVEGKEHSLQVPLNYYALKELFWKGGDK